MTKAEYMRAYRARRVPERRARAINWLGGRCAKCGKTDHAILQFDHIDPSKKSFSIADA